MSTFLVIKCDPASGKLPGADDSTESATADLWELITPQDRFECPLAFPSIFEMVAEQIGFKEEAFSKMLEKESISLSADKAILFLNSVIDFLKDENNPESSTYFFNDQSGQLFSRLEKKGHTLEASCGLCCIFKTKSPDEYEDARDHPILEELQLEVVEKPSLEVFGEDLQSFLKVAHTAKKLNSSLVITTEQ